MDSTENAEVPTRDGKLTLPQYRGAHSLGPYMDALIGEVASDLRTVSIDGAGYFLGEETPLELARLISEFVAENVAP